MNLDFAVRRKINMSYNQELTEYFHVFELGCYTPEGQCPEWLLYRSPEATRLLLDKAASLGGRISVSHFVIAFGLLRDSGAITQLRQAKPVEIDEPDLTVEQYRAMPTRTVVMKYQSDKAFKAQVDSLVERGLI
jgi:hypothetical protein